MCDLLLGRDLHFNMDTRRSFGRCRTKSVMWHHRMFFPSGAWVDQEDNTKENMKETMIWPSLHESRRPYESWWLLQVPLQSISRTAPCGKKIRCDGAIPCYSYDTVQMNGTSWSWRTFQRPNNQASTQAWTLEWHIGNGIQNIYTWHIYEQ
jgi:hypothetical protein